MRSLTIRTRLIGVEAGSHGITPVNAARFAGGSAGVLQGTGPCSDADGVELTHHLAGLDYASVGPEHAWLRDRGRSNTPGLTTAALAAFKRLGREEGSPCSSSHAVARVRLAATLPSDAILLVNLSGRGDKDVLSVQQALEPAR